MNKISFTCITRERRLARPCHSCWTRVRGEHAGFTHRSI